MAVKAPSGRVGVILQARFASSRLPGKALLPLGGTTILEQCLRRLQLATEGDVILATTDRADDDGLAVVAARIGVPVFRGSSDDVLGRVVEAASWRGCDVVIRATGDNPAVDPTAVRRLLDHLRAVGADYACEDGLPLGAGVEAITSAALARTALLANRADDREHVTTFIKAHAELFHVARPMAPLAVRRPDVRLTIDTQTDLAFMRRVFDAFPVTQPALAEIIDIADRCQRSDAA